MIERDRRISRPWRIAFVLYALALTVGTHWPRLELPPEAPAGDKTIHLAAFGGLAFLLWQTRWIKRLWLLGAIGVWWAAVDELTQGLPGLHRHVSTYDLMANILGTLIVLAWMWAVKPVGVVGGANRMRHQVARFVLEELFAERKTWKAMIITLFVTGFIAYVIHSLFIFDEQQAQWLILIWFKVTFWSILILLVLQRNVKFKALQTSQPCLKCGAIGTHVANARMNCPTCGTSQSETAWVQAVPPASKVLWRFAKKPLLLATAVLTATFLAIALLPVLYSWHLNQPIGGSAMRITRFVGTLPQEFTAAVDVAFYSFVLAAAFRIYITGLADFYDRSAICLQCGHDLRGTPTNEQGIGRCGECGAAFVRLHQNEPGNAVPKQNETADER